MNYYVTIDYKRGPAFGVALVADSEQGAIEQAKDFAAVCGYDDPVKRVKVSIVSDEVEA